MESEKIIKNDVVIFRVKGDIDAYSSPSLKDKVVKEIENGTKKIVLNLTNVDYIDSAGLGVLVALLKRIKKEQGILRISGLKPNILKIFQLTRLNQIFDIYNTEEEASNL
jgi:anti-sigma B factor antagonist